MTTEDIKEVKKQFSLDHCTIDHICGCYVNNEKEKQAVSKDAFMSLPDEEQHKYFEFFKKTLTGTQGKNLLDLEFPLAEEAEGGKQTFLLKLRDSRLDDDNLIDSFYDLVIENYDTVEKYYIILIHAVYDVPGMTTDRIMEQSCTTKDCRNSPRSGPSSISSNVPRIDSSVDASTAVLPEMIPALALTTCCATSKTAMVMLKVFVISMTATKVLKTHLKNIHVSKFARLL